MKTYCARICWNSQGWTFPTGEAKTLEKGSYVTRAGFGHEEWLFNFAWLIGDHHYAFLQPIDNSIKKVTGQVLNLLLYSVNPSRDKVYVGEIHKCEVLAPKQAEAALQHYKGAGWLKSMKRQIAEHGGNPSRLKDASVPFNVRFRPSDADIYSPYRVAARSDVVRRFNRYKLIEVKQSSVLDQWRRRKGTRIAPTVQTITRSGHPGVTYDPIHTALQGELMKLLQKEFGRDSVTREEDFVDIKVSVQARQILIEIKSDGDARGAIRKALGQILEYAYFEAERQGANLELVITAPAPETPKVRQYLDRLRERFSIPINYCEFSLGRPLPKLFTTS